MRAVRQRRTRAQGGRNEDCFAEFDFSRASVKRCLAMDLDAVGALRRERDCDRHQFLVFLRDCTIGKRGLI